MIQIDNKYVNDIKYNGNSIGRIMLDGDIYWGNEPAPAPTPVQHLIHGTTTATSSFNIGINKQSFSAAANVPVIVENGEFWLDELPNEYSTVTSLTGCFSDCSQITSIDMFNIDTSNLVNNDSCVRTWLGAGNQVTSIGKLNIDFSNIDYLWDACSWLGGITEADLSGWIVSTNTRFINGLFAGCTNLQHINLSNWQLPSSCVYRDPFYGVYNLVDITMNNVSQGTFDVIIDGLKRASKTSVKVYRDGVTYVYRGGTWVVE